MSGLRITYSLADQSFAKTKSIGIFNLSLGLLRELQSRPEVDRLDVLTNSTLRNQILTASKTGTYDDDAAIAGRIGRMKWDQWDVYSAARRRRNEWLFLPKGFASFLRRPPVRLATYVHDTIHEFYRDQYPSVVSGFEDRYFARGLRATIRHSDVIFTNSEFTRDEVIRVAGKLGLNPPPVIHAGIGFVDEPVGAVADKSGIVVLAGRFPHKLTAQMIDWMDRWERRSRYADPVHWIGALPAGVTFPNRSNWHLHSRLTEEDYRAKIAGAKVLLFASEYEGFGMPPVEAALVGTVPVFSRIPATLEVMGESGVSFANDSHNSFTAALADALKTSPEQVSAWKQELLSRHNWKSVADRIIDGLKATPLRQ